MSQANEFEYLCKRWDHQVKAEEQAFALYLRQSSNFGFGSFMEPGTGKTFTMINILRRMINHEKKMFRTLIVAPPVVLGNWKEELKKFSRIEPRRIHILDGKGKSRLKTFNACAFDQAFAPIPAIFITNYEAVTGRPGGDLDKLFYQMLAWGPEVLILDESHKLKSPQAKRTKRVEILANPSDKRMLVRATRPKVFLLTGSPILNSPMDLFSQFLIMDGGESFGHNFFEFRGKYFRDKNVNMPSQRHFPDWVPKPGALVKIQEIISRKSIVVYKKDCLDLPPLVKQKILLSMTPEQTKHYEEMKKELVTYMGSEACVAQLAMTKALRLLQISSGFLRVEDMTDIPLKENPKKNALKDLLEDLAPYHKIIVWAVFKQDYLTIKDVCKSLCLPMVALHGGLSTKEKNENVLKFNTDKTVRILIGHPGSGGIGVNLTASNYSIYFSRTFSLEQRIQSEARNYRGGSEIHEKITHIDLVMKDTIEEKVLTALDNKTEIGLSILKSLGG